MINFKKNVLSAAVKAAPIYIFGALAASQALAAPTGGVIRNNGAGDIGTIEIGSDTQVTITSDFAEIDWETFSLESSDSADFDFVDGSGDSLTNSASNLVVNHINGGRSDILGSISSNGHVILINPRGVIFSETSTVNVAAFTVSALNSATSLVPDGNGVDRLQISADGVLDAEYDGGGDNITSPGIVSNSGSITAGVGGVTLIGNSIQNIGDQGVISAVQGTIHMVSANAATLSFDAEGLVSVQVAQEALGNELDLTDAVFNSGELHGANVIVESSVADDFFDSAVNNEGSISATRIDTSSGVIRLSGNVVTEQNVVAVSTSVLNSGSLDASADLAGSIFISGENIIHSGVASADAEAVGDGGTISMAADSSLSITGTLNAAGNGAGNAGGSITTAAGDVLVIDGDTATVNTSGVSGADAGSWEIESKAIAVSDAVDCVDNCVTQDLVETGLVENGAVTIRSTGADNGDPDDFSDGIVISERLSWSDNTLNLESSTSVAISGIGPGGGGPDDIDGDTLNIAAVDGFTNNHDVKLENLQLTLGAAGVDSSSDLGNLEVTNAIQIAGNTGTDSVSIADITDSSELTAAVDGSVSVQTSSVEVIALADVDSIAASASDTLVGTVGNDAFALQSGGAVSHQGVDFIGIGEIDALGGDEDTLVSASGEDWSITNGEVDQTANFDLVSVEILQANGSGLQLNGDNDLSIDAVSDITRTGLNVKFRGVDQVSVSGAGANSLDATQLAAVYIKSDDVNTVEAGGVDFVGLNSFSASDLDSARESVNVEFAADADNTLTVGEGASQVTFNTVDTVIGDAGDIISSSNNWLLSDTGSDASSFSIFFSGAWHASASGLTLTGTSTADQFVLNSLGDVETNGLTFEGLGAVIGGTGADQLTATDWSSGTLFLQNSSGSSVSTLSANGTVFSGLSTVTADRLDTTVDSVDVSFSSASSNTLTLGAGASQVSFNSVDTVTGNTGDSITSSDDWLLSNTGSDASSFNVLFSGAWYANATGLSLTGSSSADAFVLNSVGNVEANGLTFDGVSAVLGGSGADQLTATDWSSGTLYLQDAAANQVSTLAAGGIVFSGLSSINADRVDVAIDGVDASFTSNSSNTLTLGSGASQVRFNSVDLITGNAGDNITSSDNWVLSDTGSDATSSNILFSGAWYANATDLSLTGTGNSDQFVLNSAGNLEVNGLTFDGLGTVLGGVGADELTATDWAGGTLYLQDDSGSSVSTLSTNGTVFSGLSTITADRLDTTEDGVDVSFSTSASNTLTLGSGAAQVTFNSVDTLTGDTGDNISSSDNWVLSGSDASSFNILFSGAWYASATGLSLTGTSGSDAFALNSAGNVEANSLTFEGLSTVLGGAGADQLTATDWSSGTLYLQDDAATSVSTLNSNGAVFSGLSVINADRLDAAIDGVDVSFTSASNNTLTLGSGASLVTFNSVDSVLGNAGDSITSSDNWVLPDTGSDASSFNIGFSGGWSVNASDLSLTGTSGSDLFVLNSAGNVEANGLTFNGLDSVLGGAGTDQLTATDWASGTLYLQNASGSSVSTLSSNGTVFSSLSSVTADRLDSAADGVDVAFTSSSSNTLTLGSGASQVSFNSVDTVTGNTGDSITSSDNWLLSDTGSDASSFNILFSGTWYANASGLSLTGTSNSDQFVLDSSGNIAANGLTFEGLATVLGGVGTDQLTATDYADGVKLTATPDSVNVVNGNTLISGLESVSTSALEAADSNTVFTLTGTGITVAVDNIESTLGFTGLATINGADGGSEIVRGASDWTIESGASGTFATAGDGFVFLGVDTLETTAGTLQDNVGGSQFVLTDGENIGVHNMGFSGLASITAMSGSALDASSYTAGLSLTENTDELAADSLRFTGIDRATTGILTGTSAAEQFAQIANNQLSVGGVTFSSVNSVVGAGGADELSSVLNSDWILASGATALEHGGVTFSGVTQISGGSGSIQGHTDGHTFALNGDNQLAVGSLSFSDITSVTAAGMSDQVNAIDTITLSSVSNALETNEINFSGIDSVSASDLIGSNTTDQFSLTGSSSLTVNDIEFSGLSTVSGGGNADEVVSRVGQGYTLQAGGTVSHDGIVFSAVEEFQAQGAGDLDASAFVSGLQLTGNDGEVQTDTLIFTGLSTVNTPLIQGSSTSEAFTVASDTSISVLSLLFSGVSEVTSGSNSDSVTGASGESWSIVDADTAENLAIAFHAFTDLTATDAGLLGTAGDDTFTLSGSQSDASVSYNQMAFSGLTHVDGNGSVTPDTAGDHLDAQAYSDALALTGSDKELDTGSLVFSKFDSSVLSLLDGSSGDDSFSVTSDDAITVAGLNISGLSEVDGKEGSNTLTTDGTIALNQDGSATNGTINFFDIDRILAGALDATDGDDLLAFADNGNVMVNGIEVGSTTFVDAKDGTDTVTGADGQDWTIEGLNSAENNGVQFVNVEVLEATNAGLLGTSGEDNFTLDSAGTIAIGNLLVSGLSFIDGQGDTDSLDASAYSSGVTLTGTAGELSAGALEIYGIEEAVTGTLTGTSGIDQFTLADTGELSAGSVLFTGLSQVIGAGGEDLLSSTLSEDWVLDSTASSVDQGSINFSGITQFSGGNGVIQGHTGGHDFSVTGDNQVSVVALNFSDIVTVNAATGADDVTAPGSVTLASTEGAFATSTIDFTGIDSVSASDLIGSNTADQFSLTGSSSLTANNIDFSGLSTVSGGGNSDTVVSRAGQGYTLQAGGSVSHDGIVFSAVEEFQAQGDGDLDASAFVSGLQLTGNDGEVQTDTLIFTGLSTVNTPLIQGSSTSEAFSVASDASISVLSLLFNGVSEVTSGSNSDSVTGASGVNWELVDTDTAENLAIAFHEFTDLTATDAGLLGTAGDDTFTLSGSQSDASVSYNQMAFGGLTHVDGNGSVTPDTAGDHLDAQAYSDALALTGSDKELDTGSLVFSNIDSSVLSLLDGSSGDDNFSVTSDDAITVAGLNISGLSEVDGKEGSNTLSSDGTIALNQDGSATNGTINFFDIDRILAGALDATDGDDLLAFADNGNVMVNGIEVGATTFVDAKDGTDTVTGADGQDWTIEGLNSAENNGVQFVNVEVLEATNAGLLGTSGEDNFTLDSAGTIAIGNLLVSGLSFIDGQGDTDSLDASAYSSGVTLTGTAGELNAGTLEIYGIEEAVTGTLTGTSGIDQFDLADSGELSAGSVLFTGLSQVIGAGGEDLLSSTLSEDWVLDSTASSVDQGSINFNGITQFSGGNGVIQGHTGGHDFSVAGNNQVSVAALNFSDIVTVNAATGADDVTALSSVTLASTEGAFTTSTIDFTGIDSATASDLVGTSAAEQFTLSGDGALSVNGIAFTGLNTLAAGDGDGDEVVSRSGQGYQLQANNAVQNDGIVFSGVEHFQGAAAQLEVTGQTSARITGSGNLESGTSAFSGINSLSLVGGATDLEVWNGVALAGSGAVSSGDISVTGVTTVSATAVLTGSNGGDEFIVTGVNTVSSADIVFSDVDSVVGAAGADSVAGLAGIDWQLGSDSGFVSHAAIDFTGVEQASGGSGIVHGSDVDTEFTLTSASQLLASGIQFENIQTVNAGAGSDTVHTQNNLRWVLGANTGSASVSDIVFNSVERITTESAIVDAAQNNASESFALSANDAEISVSGLLFESVAEVFAGNEGSNEVVSNTDSWQLTSGGQVIANGVTFNGIDRAVGENAQLLGTSDDENFVLTGVSGELTAGGIDFSGIDSVVGSGGTDTVIGTDTDETFTLAANGGIGIADILFTEISSVDTAGGEDTLAGGSGSWRSATENSSVINGSAIADLESISVLFENLEQIENTGAYSGPDFDTDYVFSSPANLSIGGVNFSQVTSIAAGSGSDTLYGIDADLSWTLDASGGRFSGDQSSVAFNGIENIVAGAGADTFTLEGGVLSALDAGAGNDIVYMSGTLLESLLLGAGDDEVQVLAGSQPTVMSAGVGEDRLQIHLTDQQWQVTGGKDAQNRVGEFRFTGFELLQDVAGGLRLISSQQLDFATTDNGAAANFAAGGMTLEYDPNGDLVLQSSSAATIGGSLVAKNADLTLAGDLDIESDVESLSLRSSAGNIDVAIAAKENLQIDQINVQRGDVSLTSAGFGVLTAKEFGETHITAANINLGSESQRWSNLGTEINPLRMDASQSVEIVAFSYFEPAFVGQQPAFTATGDKLESIAGAQAAQGLKSAIQNPVDDIAHLDPGIFSEVTPYSLGVSVLNLPEVRLQSGELIPLHEDDEERRRRGEEPVAVGGN